jgi:hypothetical protein
LFNIERKSKIYLNFSRFFLIINEESAEKESSAEETVKYFPPVALNLDFSEMLN